MRHIATHTQVECRYAKPRLVNASKNWPIIVTFYLKILEGYPALKIAQKLGFPCHFPKLHMKMKTVTVKFTTVVMNLSRQSVIDHTFAIILPQK